MPICGAKTRKGTPCTQKAMQNGRCRMHGGKSTGPKSGKEKIAKNALSHGIYTSGLSDHEKGIYSDIQGQTGFMDQEIAVARVSLLRALEAKQAFLSGEPALICEESEEVSGTDTKYKTIRRHPDYDQIIDRCLGRIGNLEKIRHEMLNSTPGAKETPEETALRIHQALKQIEQTDGSAYNAMDKTEES